VYNINGLKPIASLVIFRAKYIHRFTEIIKQPEGFQMKRVILTITFLLLASSVFAGGMLKKSAVELGGSFALSIQDGEKYDDEDGKSRTVIDVAAEPGGFLRDGLLIGGYLGWIHYEQIMDRSDGMMEIGPRIAYYFSQSPHGSVFMESAVHFSFSDKFEKETTSILSLGIGHLFPITGRAALAPMVNYRYFVGNADQISSEGYEIEFRIGLKFFHFRRNTNGGSES
jgi:hypothetical protein